MNNCKSVNFAVIVGNLRRLNLKPGYDTPELLKKLILVKYDLPNRT